MPRRDFLADLEKLRETCPWNQVSGIRRGDDDLFYFSVSIPEASEPVEITCVVLPELAQYPIEHYYQMFLEDDNAPDSIANTIQHLPPMKGYSISNAIDHVTKSILNEKGNIDSENKGSIAGESSDLEEEDEEQYESSYEEDEHFVDQRRQTLTINQLPQPVAAGKDVFSRSEMQRIRIDIAMAKTAGFKVACYGNVFRCPMNFHLSLSIRISKLGISEDAMEAWKLEASDYLILAFCFKNGYKSLESILTDDRDAVRYKIGLSKVYKPSYTTLAGVFSGIGYDKQQWKPTFISKALEELMNKRFIFILKNRSKDLGWSGAERLYHAQEGHQPEFNAIPDAYKQPDEVHGTYPDVVTYDHYTDPLESTAFRSFPLVAMQFLLRHFVRCTEFCLVCHRPLTKVVEAIKPYVCEEPLCLFQYMSLGFGPGIEHEILTQPLVVDLLISFAWAACKGRKLEALPRGLGLLVPSIRLLGIKGSDYYLSALDWVRTHGGTNQLSDGLATPPGTAPVDPFEAQEVKVDWEKKQLVFEFGKPHHITSGMWLVILEEDKNDETDLMHCKVVKTYPDRVHFTRPFSALEDGSKELQGGSVRVIKYDQSFDEMSNTEALASLLLQINLLPSVAEMEIYLREHPHRTLADWHERLSPAAIGILRWIIASNRACIKEDNDNSIVKDVNSMKQFRFTMGAPDKEKRFVDQVLSTTKRLNLTHPTILAFHGSPMYNWHSIIREGLHFNYVLHGRAQGNGVYHSLQFDVSNGYTHGFGHYQSPFPNGDCWNRSRLLLKGVVAINEIVNAPREWVSTSPHLVISNVDWIQTRYLIVSCKGAELHREGESLIVQNEPEAVVVDGFIQDPAMPLRLPYNRSFAVLPLKAGSYTRLLASEKMDARKRKAEVLDNDDSCSICTVHEDDEVLVSDPIWKKFVQVKNQASRVATLKETVQALRIREPAANFLLKSSTNFVPGVLDHNSLPRLPPPDLASPAASKAIMSSLKEIRITVESENVIELGWYVDVQKVDNIFQWIVELHSFPENLPLTKQMVEAKLPSIVIELRFPDQYPFAPPFARVVRPKMLPFASGGGGHVTAGGSICMELLTASGWSPALSIMNVLLNIRLAICETQPQPAQLDRGVLGSDDGSDDYTIGEAVSGYLRACRMHGWRIPEGFNEWSVRM